MDIIQWKRRVGSSTSIITISLHFTSASDHHERHQVLLTTVTGLSLPSAWTLGGSWEKMNTRVLLVNKEKSKHSQLFGKRLSCHNKIFNEFDKTAKTTNRDLPKVNIFLPVLFHLQIFIGHWYFYLSIVDGNHLFAYQQLLIFPFSLYTVPQRALPL